MQDWPQFNEGDLEAYVSNLKENEQVFSFNIENTRTTDMHISIEPQGSCDTFPVGAIYEVVVVTEQVVPDIHIQIKDDWVVVYCNRGWGAIFHNGAATLAY